MKICNSINFSITSSYSSITSAVDSILEFVSGTGNNASDEVYFDIKVILNELIVNAIKHGNGCDCSKRVNITAALTDDDYLCLMVKDEGKGYDTKGAAQKCLVCCEVSDILKLDECGRGMLIVKNLSDRIEISDNGSRIEVYKKL
jgi:serine/threonine-protein kinase RsbW